LNSAALSSFTWETHFPHDGDLLGQGWLLELSEMRGRVLHAGGRRPQFHKADGSFIDVDPLDRYAYHILLRSSTYIIGCIRVVPLTSVSICGTESLLGRQGFEQMLVHIGTTRDKIGEVGRWIVAPEYSRFRMGLRLIRGVGVLSKWLGLETVIATVGTRDGQAETLMRSGGRRVPGLSPIKSQKYNDDLVVLTFDLMHLAKSLGPLAAKMETLLSLETRRKAHHGSLPFRPQDDTGRVAISHAL
jgi:hypothetical protein